VQCGECPLDPLAILVGEMGEPIGEPGRTPGPHTPENRATLGRQLEPDAPAVVLRPHAAKESCRLQPVDVPGERRRGDALRVCELPEGESRLGVHEREERRLVGGHAERIGLAAEIPGEAENRLAELAGDLER
jgi:hypothetical protein